MTVIIAPTTAAIAPIRHLSTRDPPIRFIAARRSTRLGGTDRSARPTVEAVVTLARTVAATIRHEVRFEMGVLDPEVTLQRGIGSCRDSAWLLIQCFRHLGLAARFVSGYLVELAPGGDVTDLHAWAEVYLPGAGWVGIDPTSGLLAAEGHIALAASPHPRGAAAVVGSTEPCEVRLEHSNSVRRTDAVDREALLPLTE